MNNHQRITIIGTGCVGTSMGLALRQSKDAEHLEIVGHDKELGRARQAQKLGAFDRVEFNLDLALRDARLIIITVPLSAMRDVLADLGRLLSPDAAVVVTDTAPLKAPVITWAEELLPPGNYFVGGDPFLAPGVNGWEPLRGPSDARPDLLRQSVYAITARENDHPSAVQAVTNLALVLGGVPLYMDPEEHDAARSIANAVPDLVATALFQATAESPGWAEVRKAASRSFATATAAAAGDAASRRMLALLGRAPLLRGLDAVIERLQGLRAQVAAGEAEALESNLANVSQAREYWIAESSARVWEIERGAINQDGLFQRTLQALLGEAPLRKPEKPKGDTLPGTRTF